MLFLELFKQRIEIIVFRIPLAPVGSKHYGNLFPRTAVIFGLSCLVLLLRILLAGIRLRCIGLLRILHCRTGIAACSQARSQYCCHK